MEALLTHPSVGEVEVSSGMAFPLKVFLQLQFFSYYKELTKLICLGGQVVKTPAFHAGNTGSNPVRGTNMSVWWNGRHGRLKICCFKRVGSSPTTDTRETVDIFFVSNNSANVTKQTFTTSGCEALSLYENKGKLRK